MSLIKPKIISRLSPAFLRGMAVRIKLILRLMADRRVNPLIKLLPVFSVLYAVWPIDIPLPIDDAAVLILGAYLFVELCPPEVVQEHLERIRNSPQVDWGKANVSKDEIIEGEFREVDSGQS